MNSFACISLWCKLCPWEWWRLKEGSSWMQGTKLQHSNSKTLFWQAFKGVCRYLIFPVASKLQAKKRCEFSCKYLYYGASYESSMTCILTQSSFFIAFKGVCRYRIFPVATR
jgi:hypothetical protein